MNLLFEPLSRFEGLPKVSFELFELDDRQARRHAIIETIHPPLKVLGDDLLERLNPLTKNPLHAHLPRLDWPRGYQPFCTWLALSAETHGYQSGPQLNVGVHADFVALRLGWDTAADAYGRFELLARHGDLGEELVEAAAEHALEFRVFSAAPWPRGSQVVFESPVDLRGSLDEVARRGVWWELGRFHPIPEMIDHVCSPELGLEAFRIFRSLVPLCERMVVSG